MSFTKYALVQLGTRSDIWSVQRSCTFWEKGGVTGTGEGTWLWLWEIGGKKATEIPIPSLGEAQSKGGVWVRGTL